jgi:hypothetical protein
MRLRKAIRAAVTVVVVAGALVTGPTAAQAVTGDGWVGWWNNRSTYSFGDYIMMTVNVRETAGGRVYPYPIAWPPGSTSQQIPEQDWLQTAEGGGWLSMRNASTAGWLALAVSGGRTDQGAPVIVWNYEKGHTEQQWGLTHLAGDANGFYHIRNRKSGLCLAVPGPNLYGALIQWNCEGGHTEQQWARADL